jgi:energy-coupling factor transporter ATP-binding protein EcfA2
MKLLRARITNYKSIDDSGWVDLEAVTCLVGKNESGKTAFLQALAKLNPVQGQPADYDMTLEYPRKRLNRYKREHDNEPATVVEAVYEINSLAISTIEREYGKGCLIADKNSGLEAGQLRLRKSYANDIDAHTGLDHQKVIKHLVASAGLPEEIATALVLHTTLKSFREALQGLGDDPPQAAELEAKIAKHGSIRSAILRRARWFEPQFFYFDDYSIMDGRISVPHLKAKRNHGDLTDADRTFLAMIKFVGAELEEFENESNYERLKADLEAASNEISDELFQFWTQNQELAVEFDLSGPDPEALPPLNEGTNLHVRINNRRHRVTVPFDQRSRGFVWFFSFLAYFSEIERHGEDETPLILLLDEPGLNLHATAQWDFLRFIDERLAKQCQTIYTTHSPFMLEPTSLHRVRTVIDDEERGTIVSSDIFRADSDTAFPLQAALGYDVAQTLFVAPDNLLVEGASDLIYLQVLAAACEATARESLDPRWVIVPVGGIDKIASFLSLFGAQKLNTSVLIDVSSKDQQRVTLLRESGYLGKNSLIQVGEITGTKNADIEDLFDAAFYLKLVNGSYKEKLPKSLTVTALGKGDPRISHRIQARFDRDGLGHFSHLRPATYLLRGKDDLISKIPEQTLDKASQLFERVNRNLE